MYIEQHWAQDRTSRNSTLYWLPIWQSCGLHCSL